MIRKQKTKTLDQAFSVRYSYPVIFTENVFYPENRALAELLQIRAPRRILAVLDEGLAGSRPGIADLLHVYLTKAGFGPAYAGLLVMQGGEACKNDRSALDRIHAAVSRHSLCRHSVILAIGGGAVLDAAGFAAATAHRGIPLIRMPTTTLSQCDSGVGVKNAANTLGRKNFIGTFAPPLAVVNDFELLDTLPPREMRAGIAEAVKVALIKDRAFFEFLYAERFHLASFEPAAMRHMIITCAELHLAHIRSGDPFEYGSSRPLDFGHWSAHALEEMTGGCLGHGEAVATGIALDCLYCGEMGLITSRERETIFAVLEDTGFSLFHPALLKLDIAKALSQFQEHLGGDLTIPLLTGIGQCIEVHEADLEQYRQCIRELAAEKGVADGKDTLPGKGRADAGPVLSREPDANTGSRFVP